VISAIEFVISLASDCAEDRTSSGTTIERHTMAGNSAAVPFSQGAHVVASDLSSLKGELRAHVHETLAQSILFSVHSGQRSSSKEKLGC
jgi:hypothetical protein